MRVSNDTEGLRARWKQGTAALGFAGYRWNDRFAISNECRDVHSPIESEDDSCDVRILTPRGESVSTQRMTSRILTARDHLNREAASTSFWSGMGSRGDHHSLVGLSGWQSPLRIE